MDIQSWIEGINGLASLYAFDILPDGSYSEIRLMGVNQQNVSMLHMKPDAPEFYPGIPYRSYWMDLNFESFVYQCGSKEQPLYSYVNARGIWLKGFYLPIRPVWDMPAGTAADAPKTAYCLYLITYSDQVETDSMAHKSSEVANAVMDISIKLHETPDFHQAMALTAAQIKSFCGAERCSLYIVDKSSRQCAFINENGLQKEYLKNFCAEMERTPFELAEAWEADLALSDCLLLEDLHVIEERDPVWYRSLCSYGIRNIILYAIRYNQVLVGFIWAANYDAEKRMRIKETLELSTFLISAVISNYQLVTRLELRSTVDILTGVSNRNAMNDRVDRLVSGADKAPETIGIGFADLNGLKSINDTEGHDAGDKLLVRAGSLLKLAFGDYEIYRAGGDEFVLLCPDITEEQMQAQVQQLRSLADSTPDVSFAVGSVHAAGEYDIRKLMHTADELMYKDKQEYYRLHPEKDRRTQNKR